MLHTWLPLVFWTAIIAFEFSFGSSANTGGVLQTLVRWFFGEVDPTHFDTFHYILRKGGHFAGYGILGYLWFRAFLRKFTQRMPLTSALLAIACTFFIASLDEWHQSFLPERTGDFQDVVLDTFGAAVLVSLAAISVVRRKTAALGRTLT